VTVTAVLVSVAFIVFMLPQGITNIIAFAGIKTFDSLDVLDELEWQLLISVGTQIN
jgi:hypothetical protein